MHRKTRFKSIILPGTKYTLVVVLILRSQRSDKIEGKVFKRKLGHALCGALLGNLFIALYLPFCLRRRFPANIDNAYCSTHCGERLQPLQFRANKFHKATNLEKITVASRWTMSNAHVRVNENYKKEIIILIYSESSAGSKCIVGVRAALQVSLAYAVCQPAAKLVRLDEPSGEEQLVDTDGFVFPSNFFNITQEQYSFSSLHSLICLYMYPIPGDDPHSTQRKPASDGFFWPLQTNCHVTYFAAHFT